MASNKIASTPGGASKQQLVERAARHASEEPFDIPVATPSPARQAEFSANRRDLRHIRSRQSAVRVSNIMSRITWTKEGMDKSLLERSLSVQAHDRVIRKLKVVIQMLEAMAQNLTRGKTLPMVQRDRHDGMLHKSALESLSVLYESVSEGGSLLHDLRNAVVDTRGWLDQIEDELDRVSQGTVVLAMADVTELQPLFEALYSQWCWRHGSAGRFFRAWRLQVDGMLLVRDKVAMEKIVRKLQTISVGSVNHAFAAWSTRVRKKLRKIQLKARMVLTNMFSDKVWAFQKWRAYFLQSVRSRHILDKIEFRSLLLSVEHWNQCAAFKKFRAQKRRFADRIAFKKTTSLHFSAWAVTVFRYKALRIKLRSARVFLAFKVVSSCLHRWASRYKIMIHRRRELLKSRRSWLSMHLADWRDVTSRMASERHQAALIRRRVLIRASEEAFQNWCDAIELKILRRLKADKFASRARLLTLTTIFREWVGMTSLTRAGVTAYRQQRMFVKWRRDVHVARTVAAILSRWTALLTRGSLERCFRRFQHWYDCRCDALDLLARVAEETGVLELDTAFARWRLKERRHRLRRFKLRALTRRRHLATRNFFLCFWVRKTLQRGQLVCATHRQGVRMGLRRRDINLCLLSLHAMRRFRQQQQALRHSVAAVSQRTGRRRMRQVLEGWEVLMKSKETVRRMKERLARRSAITWIRLFSRIAHQQRIRVMYGNYCPDCKRPLAPTPRARASDSSGNLKPASTDPAGVCSKAVAPMLPGTVSAGVQPPCKRASAADTHPRQSTPQRAVKSAEANRGVQSVESHDMERREYRPRHEPADDAKSPARPQGPKQRRVLRQPWNEIAAQVSVQMSPETTEHAVSNNTEHDVHPGKAKDALLDQVSDALVSAYEELEATLGRSPYSSSRRQDVSVSVATTKSQLVQRSAEHAHTTVSEAREKWHRDLRGRNKIPTVLHHQTPVPPSHSGSRSAWEELKGGLGIGLRQPPPQPQLSTALQSSPLAHVRRPRSAYAPKRTKMSESQASQRPTSARSNQGSTRHLEFG